MSSDSYVPLCTLFTLFLFFLPPHYFMVPPIAPVSFLVPLFHSLVLQFCLPHFLFLKFCNSIVLASPSFSKGPVFFLPQLLDPLIIILPIPVSWALFIMFSDSVFFISSFLVSQTPSSIIFLGFPYPMLGYSFLVSRILSPWYSFMVPPHPHTPVFDLVQSYLQ